MVGPVINCLVRVYGLGTSADRGRHPGLRRRLLRKVVGHDGTVVASSSVQLANTYSGLFPFSLGLLDVLLLLVDDGGLREVSSMALPGRVEVLLAVFAVDFGATKVHRDPLLSLASLLDKLSSHEVLLGCA